MINTTNVISGDVTSIPNTTLQSFKPVLQKCKHAFTQEQILSKSGVLSPFWKDVKMHLTNGCIDGIPFIKGPYVPEGVLKEEPFIDKTEIRMHYYQFDLHFTTKDNTYLPIIFYYKQDRMLEVMEKQEGTFPVGYDFPAAKKDKTFSPTKIYTFFSSFEEFEKIYTQIVDKQKHFYEFILPNKPCCLYFDLDMELSKVEQQTIDLEKEEESKLLAGNIRESVLNKGKLMNATECKDSFINTLRKYMQRSDIKFNCIEASNGNKTSLHIKITNLYVENNEHLVHFYSNFKEYVKNNLPTDYAYLYTIIDFSVKSRNRMMRMVGSSKLRQDGKHIREFKEFKNSHHKMTSKDTLRDSMISIISQDAQKLEVEITITSTKSQCTTTSIENIEFRGDLELLREATLHLPQHFSTNYTEWIYIGFCLKNTCEEHIQTTGDNRENIEEEYFSIFDAFSKRSTKYNKQDVKNTWDSIKSKSTGKRATVASIYFHTKKTSLKRTVTEKEWFICYNYNIDYSVVTREHITSICKLLPTECWQNTPICVLKSTREINVCTHIGIALYSLNKEWGKDVWRQFNKISDDSVIEKEWARFGQLLDKEKKRIVDYYFIERLALMYNKEKYIHYINAHPELLFSYEREPFTAGLVVNESRIDKYHYLQMIQTETKINAICSNMNTGKTHSLDVFFTASTPVVLEQLPGITKSIPIYPRILVVTFRISLAIEFHHKWKQHDFALYSDIDKSKIDNDRVIIQIDSINRTMHNAYDLVILDEVVSTVSHLVQFEGVRERNEVFKTLLRHIHFAKKVVLLDANLTDECCNLLTYDAPIYKLKNVNKSYSNLKANICLRKKEEFQKSILQYTLLEGKKPVIISNHKSFLRETADMLKTASPGLKIACIVAPDEKSDLISYEYDSLDCPADTWDNYDVLLYSPSICAGVSFNKLHFDKRFAYFTNDSCNAEMCSQMLFRVRNTHDSTIDICIEIPAISFKGITNKAVDEDLNKELLYQRNFCLKTGLTVNKHTVEKNAVFKKDSFYHLYRYVTRINNISHIYFKYVLIGILREHGIVCTYYEPVVKEEEEDENEDEDEDEEEEPVKTSSKLQLLEAENMISLLSINKEEYEELLSKKKKTSRELLQIKKYIVYTTYRLREISLLDSDTVKKDRVVLLMKYKDKTKTFLSLKMLYVCDTIDAMLEMCTEKHVSAIYTSVCSQNDIDKLYLQHIHSSLYCILSILKELGHTTIKETVNIRMNWNTLARMFKKEETVTILNKSGKMSTDFRKCPADITGLTNAKEKSKWKKGLILSLNKKLSQLLGLTLVREQNSTRSPNYENFHIEIDEYFKSLL